MHWFSRSSKLRRARQETGAHREGKSVGGVVPDAGAGREPDPYHAEFLQAEEPEERGMGGGGEAAGVQRPRAASSQRRHCNGLAGPVGLAWERRPSVRLGFRRCF